MKILAANKFYYVFGGSDRYFFELNSLHEHAGHTVIPFAMQHQENFPSPYEKFFVSPVNYWDNPSFLDKLKAAGRVLYSFEARRKIRHLIEKEKPDIAHIHVIAHQISPSILPILKEFNIPIVQTSHEYKPICPTYSLVSKEQICERCKGKRFYHATLQKCNHNSLSASALNSIEMYLHHGLGWYDLPNIYITPSNFMRKKMIEFGMPGNKIVHIPNFVDPSKYHFSAETENYFVYIGRLSRIKGVGTLLKAMKHLSSNTKLLIIGDGPQRAELEQIKETLELDHVHFLGYQDTESLTQLLAKSQFSVLPSEWYENCPMSILESMAIGKPVVGARIGGIPELIEDGQDGLLFESKNALDLADKLRYLIAKPEQCKQMGLNARRKMETSYNAEFHYQNILDVYDSILKH